MPGRYLRKYSDEEKGRYISGLALLTYSTVSAYNFIYNFKRTERGEHEKIWYFTEAC